MQMDAPVPATFNILFVCTGNTCRSPMAEAAARRDLARRGWRHVRVASAGVAARAGDPATPHAATVSARRGLDLSAHSSRTLDHELVDWADLILVMSPSHLHAVAALGGGDRADLLGKFAAGGGFGVAVPDPFGGVERDYERTLEELEGLVGAALDRITPVVHP